MNAFLQKELNEAIEEHKNSNLGDQYLTFIMDEEEYGIDIIKVMEIRSWEKPTAIPRSPEYVKGVINIRGSIVPIIGLREKFNLKKKDITKNTVVIVVQLKINNHTRIIGFIVDAISEVYEIDVSALRPAPTTAIKNGQNYIQGLASLKEKMVIVLDVENLLSFSDISSI